MHNKLYRKYIVSEDYRLLVYVGVIDVILVWFIHKYDPLGIANFYNEPVFIIGIYAVIFYILVWLCICIHNELIEKRKRSDKKLLDELSGLLVISAGLRQKVIKNYSGATEKKLSVPVDDFMDWYDKVLDLYRTLDYQKAEIWNTIEVKESDFVKSHGKYAGHLIDLLDSKINKLKADINYFSKLMDSYKWR